MNDLILVEAERVATSPHGLQLIAEALESSALIARVSNAGEQEAAAKAQVVLATVKDQFEDARKKLKAPVLALGRAIDQTAARAVAEVEAELLRVTRLNADYIQLQQARERAARLAEDERLSALKREEEAAKAKAANHQELDAIAEDFDQRRQVEALPIPEVQKAEGQIVRKDWDIVVTNAALLYARHPQCVELTPKLAEIKSLLRAGVQVEGVRATEKVIAGVRKSAAQQFIDV